ncbi:hypothetical protein H9655_08270 [Cytobacillus sp. Sa5YUA1]|uniref:Uncharacterized protein n=1 Tax=Cytobacillus stercorigallinarum TaxID=2762240 RepID=A0ABR8QNB1_9BACI|nr:hypothetical protein [Cytobacillus stercorigallinarum]MBD7937024.1 hypothetical protein [Cytobacillus stercorigallinarum]
MNNQYYRNFTILTGTAIIILAIFRAIGAFSPSILVMFCVSVAALMYSLVDLSLESNRGKKFILTFDIIAIVFLILSFTTKGMKKLFSIDVLIIPSEVVTLLAFGVVILTIGIKDRKAISETIESIKSTIYIDSKKKFSTLDSDVAKQSMLELANYEYNTVFNLNKVILELKKYDGYVQQSSSIHDGWSTLFDCLEYYRITNEGPFYDHGLNTLFWDFDGHLTSATNIFSNLSQPEGTHKIATIVIFKESFSVNRYVRMRNNNSSEEYINAYNHISDALKSWNELKSIAVTKYESLGTIDFSHQE